MATKVTITTPGVIPGQRCTMFADSDAIAPYKYLWKRNGEFLKGTDSSNKVYTTWILRQEDLTAFYSVMVYGQNGIEESAGVQILPPKVEEKKNAVANLVP